MVAGAGFGKSGLVVQALAANRSEPLGLDAWVGCQEEDVRLDRFVEALFTAVRGESPLDAPVDVDDAVHRIADAVWSHAPLPLTIVVDDVHVLGEASAGARLLGELVRRLPANAHFLLTSRTDLPFSLAHLQARGEAVVLTEDDLVMTPDELVELARQHGSPDLDLAATGGWPALAALALHTGTASSAEVEDYLTAELLDDLPKSQVRALAVLAAVGPLPVDDLVRATGDHDLDAVALTRLPLVDTAVGVVDAHTLWSVAIGFVDGDWLRRAIATAADSLRAGGHGERAFRLAVDGSDRALALDVLGDLCRASIHGSEVDLAASVAVLPDEVRDAPAALLAAALSVDGTSDDVGGAATREGLIETSVLLAQAGAADLELVALTRLGILGWQAADLSVADHLLPRVALLAGSGDPTAMAVVELGAALLAELEDDHTTMWKHIAAFEALDVAEPLHTVGLRYRASLDLQYGSAADAWGRLTDLEATAPPGLREEVLVLALWAAWLGGDGRSARRVADALRLRDADAAGGLVARSTLGLFDAWTSPDRDDRDPSGAVADAATARATGLLVPSLVSSLEAATRLVAGGDEEAAAEVLAEAFGQPEALGARARPAAMRALSLVWVLLPSWRDELCALDAGDGPAAALRDARTLCASRESPNSRSWHGDAATVLADAALACRLPPIWAAELAARLIGPKPSEEHLAIAHDAVARLGPHAAHWLRGVAAADPDRRTVAGAKVLLARRTPISEGAFTLRLLGALQIERDGVVVEEPDWRRDRVRGLFALIARRGTITRRAAAEALWPDLDPEAAANNLRVTLSYLQRVLEPDRTRHEVAYHLRSDGASLRFAGRSSWTIDVEELESSLDAAERDDERGASAAALANYLAAIEWYRGPFLADVEIEGTDEIERERLASRYIRALTRAGGLLLGAGRVEEAQRMAVAAQAADPWSELAACLQAEAYLAAGDRAAARRALGRATEILDELGLGPSSEIMRLERILAP